MFILLNHVVPAVIAASISGALLSVVLV